MSQQYIQNSLAQAQQTITEFIENEKNIKAISHAIAAFVTSLKAGGRILSCGNGGSMCDSMHFAEELTGRYRKDRPPISAMAMGDAGHLTCVANDFGYEYVFSRYVESWGRQGDSLLAISTSGNSQNVINAVKVAQEKRMTTVGLLGKSGGQLKDLVDIPIIVNSQITDRIQEIHIKVIHTVIEGIERELYPEHYS